MVRMVSSAGYGQLRAGAGSSQSGGGALPSPQFVQHIASSTNPEGLGVAGNAYKLPLPNAVGAGNCLILAITYPNGNTPTVTDNNSNSWPGSPTVSADAGSGKYVAAIFVLPNANAGLTTLTV